MNIWQALEGYLVAHLTFHTNQLKAADQALHLNAGTLEGEWNTNIVPLAAGVATQEAAAAVASNPTAANVVNVADTILSTVTPPTPADVTTGTPATVTASVPAVPAPTRAAGLAPVVTTPETIIPPLAITLPVSADISTANPATQSGF